MFKRWGRELRRFIQFEVRHISGDTRRKSMEVRSVARIHSIF